MAWASCSAATAGTQTGMHSVLDANRRCPSCGQKWANPKYLGKFFHDFRRSAAYEMWKAGSTIEDCKQVTGHKTDAMFKRYADLFSEEEVRNRQREVQRKRHEWRQDKTQQSGRAAGVQEQALFRRVQ